jgi:hypothetical protein
MAVLDEYKIKKDMYIPRRHMEMINTNSFDL